MAEYTPDWISFPHADGIVKRLVTQLAEMNLPEACFATVVPGELAALDNLTDECAAMAYSRVTSVFPSTTSFPSADASPRSGYFFASIIELGLIRTIELPDNGEAPSAEAQREAARLQAADMGAMLTAICAYCTDYSIPVVLGAYQPVGPEGGVVGGFWTATLQAT